MPSQSEMDVDTAPDAVAGIADVPRAATDTPRSLWPRILRKLRLGIITRYLIIATTVGLSLAATLHYCVTPQIAAGSRRSRKR